MCKMKLITGLPQKIKLLSAFKLLRPLLLILVSQYVTIITHSMCKTKGAIFKCNLVMPFICLKLTTLHFYKSRKTMCTWPLPNNSDANLSSDLRLFFFFSSLFLNYFFYFLKTDKKFPITRESRDFPSSAHIYSNSL